MIFRPTPLAKAFLIDLEKREDERGFFARSWCADEFLKHGLNPRLAQCNISYNKKKGTLRGMHYQGAPFEEAKLVRCTRGSLYDVIIDLRADSPTYKEHFFQVLSRDNHIMLYVPEGFAHGFQTLEDDTEIFYQMSQSYHASYGRGVRYNDPQFDISWPITELTIADRDRSYPDFGG